MVGLPMLICGVVGAESLAELDPWRVYGIAAMAMGVYSPNVLTAPGKPDSTKLLMT